MRPFQEPTLEELKARNKELERLVEEMTQELEEASAAAEAANEAKATFLSTVSHELRTPLTSMLGFTKLNKKSLEEKIFPAIPKDQPKARKAAQRIAKNLDVVKMEGERLTTLINDLLDLSKIESGKVEWKIEVIHPSELIESALAATTSFFDHKPTIQLSKEIAHQLPQVRVDKERMIQVLINLISNAVKFTDEGQVKIGVKPLPFPIISGPSAHRKQLIFFLEDTGIGIPEEYQEKIFEKFQQVETAQSGKPPGTGLGLPICREIVERHKGKLWLESELGKGSMFAFTVPV